MPIESLRRTLQPNGDLYRGLLRSIDQNERQNTLIYHRFHIKIVTSPEGEYRVWTASNRGEGRSTLTLPIEIEEAARLHSHPDQISSTRRVKGLLGEQLFDALFRGETLLLYERSLEYLETSPTSSLRIEIELDPQDQGLTKLQALPWELLRQPKTPEYIALNRRRSIVRYLAVPFPVTAFQHPKKFRILAVVADPRLRAHYSLDLESELRNLRTAISRLPNVEVVTPPVASLDALREALNKEEFHVLHFMGHGGMIPGQQERVIFFEGKNRSADPVSGTDLLNKLTGFQALRLVVLNACDSGEVPMSDFNPFAGVATSLLVGGLPAVVAMQSPVSDAAAIAFSQRFYQHLAAGASVDSALVEGRQAMHSVDQKSFEWAIPVLLSRTLAEHFFSVNDAGARDDLVRHLEGPLGELPSRVLPPTTSATIGRWPALLRSVLENEIPRQLRSVDPTSGFGVGSAITRIVTNPSFDGRLIPANRSSFLSHSFSLVDSALLSPTQGLGVLPSPGLACDISGMSVAFPAFMVGTAALFKHLEVVQGLALEVNYSFAHALEIERLIGCGLIYPDVCVFGDAPALALMAGEHGSRYDFSLPLPRIVQRIVGVRRSWWQWPRERLKGELFYIADRVSTPMFLFEELERTGRIDRRLIKESPREPHESVGILESLDPEAFLVLWSPYWQIYERLGLAESIRDTATSFGSLLFLKRSLKRRQPKVCGALVTAIRAAWIDLLNPRVLDRVIGAMLLDQRYLELLFRYCGLPWSTRLQKYLSV